MLYLQIHMFISSTCTVCVALNNQIMSYIMSYIQITYWMPRINERHIFQWTWTRNIAQVANWTCMNIHVNYVYVPYSSRPYIHKRNKHFNTIILQKYMYTCMFSSWIVMECLTAFISIPFLWYVTKLIHFAFKMLTVFTYTLYMYKCTRSHHSQCRQLDWTK